MSETAKRNVMAGLGVLLVFIFVVYLGVQAFRYVSNFTFLHFFSDVFGKEVVTDSKHHTNILLLGVGGEGHDGADLTDTMMVASIDQQNHTVGMLSIPRDMFVRTPVHNGKINALYATGKAKWDSLQSLDYMREQLGDMLGIEIHYYVKVDFEAFKELVDAVGGIDINVEMAINDQEYPKDGTYEFEPFILAAGMQHLDGEIALKYARSRHTSSDFDRSRRQQEVIVALRNKAQQASLLSKASFIKDTYYSLNEHVETNLTTREMISLAEFAAGWDSSKLSNATLTDDPNAKGGFLYTPDRSLFNGGAVLVMAGTSDSMALEQYAEAVLYPPEGFLTAHILVLNGTKQNGLAGRVSNILFRYGLPINKTANARLQNLKETTWYTVKPGSESIMNFVTKLLPAPVEKTLPPEYMTDPNVLETTIVLELGEDAASYMKKLDVFRELPYPVAPVAPTPSTATPTTTTPPTSSTP